MSGLLLSLLLLIHSPADEGAAGDMRILRTLVLGDGGPLLYSVSGVSTDQSGNVYVSDMLDYSVKKFNRQGTFLKKVGRRGTGPGQFRSPALSLVVGGKLIVLQAEDRRIQTFDTDLMYRGEFAVTGGIPVDIAPGFLRGYAIALYTDSSHGTVLRFDGPLTMNPRRIQLLPTGKIHPLYAATRIALFPDGSIVAGYLFMNRVEIYGPDGRLRRWFSLTSMPLANGRDDDGRVPEETFVRKVLVNRAGEIFLLGGNQAPHPGRDIFIYRADGSFIRTLVIPGRTRLIAAGGNTTLYVTDESGSRVERYRICGGKGKER